MNWKLFGLAFGGLLLLVAVVIAAGVSPIGAVKTLADGTFGSASNITGTLKETTPLLMAGIAVFIALRAGLFNIGVEGQLLLGAMTASIVALRFPGPVGIVSAALAGMVAGAIWALPAGLIKAYRNGHEVITTIMLNTIADRFTSAMVAGPIKAPGGDTSTAQITKSTMVNNLTVGSIEVSPALMLGLAGAIGIAWWLRRTVSGFELEATGANPTAAKFAGVETKRVTVQAMLVSGAIAGLAGAFQVLAFEHRFYSGFSPGYGFDALGVALLAGAQAAALIPAALLFGILAKGSTALQIEGLPKGLTTVILGVLILVTAAIRYRRAKRVA